MKDICIKYTIYTWGSCILSHLYQYLNENMIMGKSNIIIAHVSFIQVWTYEHIAMFKAV